MASAKANGISDRGPARILTVDDIETNRGVLNRLLARRGYVVIEAAGGCAALEEVDREPPNLVLLDINMPDLSGMETLRQLRLRFDGCELPIIMVTAEHDTEMVAACLEAGANDYVTKPIQWPVLHARIETHLGLHRAHAQLLEDRDRLEAAVSARTSVIERIDQALAHNARKCEAIQTH